MPNISNNSVKQEIFSTLQCFSKVKYSESLSEKLRKLGIASVQSVLTHLPLRYEDLSRVILLRDAKPNTPAQFDFVIRKISTFGFGKKRRILLSVADDSANAVVRFFNLYPSQINVLTPGTSIRVYGEVKFNRSKYEFLHPRWSLLEKAPTLSDSLSPIYPLTSGLKQKTFQFLVNNLLKLLYDDFLPNEYISKLSLLPLKESFRLLHQPAIDANPDEILHINYPPRKRLAFDEIVALQILLKQYRKKTAQKRHCQ